MNLRVERKGKSKSNGACWGTFKQPLSEAVKFEHTVLLNHTALPPTELVQIILDILVLENLIQNIKKKAK